MRQRLVQFDLDDHHPLAVERLQKALLVFVAPLRDTVQHRIETHGLGEMPPQGRPLKIGEVRALQEPHQVGGGVHHPSIDPLHMAMLPVISGSGAGRVSAKG